MISTEHKKTTLRTARGQAVVRMSPALVEVLKSRNGPKGDALEVARAAGVMAAKRTAELVPLCHVIPLDHVDVSAVPDPELPGVRVRAVVQCTGRTGVEMEALTAVSVALLAVYDMVKAVDRGMEIGDIQLTQKSGGRSGDWHRAQPEDV